MASPSVSPSPPPTSPSATHALLPLDTMLSGVVLPGVFRCYSPTASEEPMLAQRVDNTARASFASPLEREYVEKRRAIETSIIERLKASETTIQEQATQLSSLQTKVAGMQQAFDLQREISNTQQTMIEQLTEESTRYQELLEQQQRALVQRKKAIEQLQGESGQLQWEVKELREIVAQLRAENLVQQEDYERRITQLERENAEFKKEIALQKRVIAAQQQEMEQQLAAAREEAAQQLAAVKKETAENLKQQLIVVEENAAEKLNNRLAAAREEADSRQEKMEQQLSKIRKEAAEQLTAAAECAKVRKGKLREELGETKAQLEETQQRLGKTEEEVERLSKMEEEVGLLCLGNILQSLFDETLRQAGSTQRLPSRGDAFVFIMNKRFPARHSDTVVGILSQIAYYANLEEIKREEDDYKYFEAIYDLFSSCRFLSCLPKEEPREEQIFDLCLLVVDSSSGRNAIAHQKERIPAQKGVDAFIRKHGKKWRQLIEAIAH